MSDRARWLEEWCPTCRAAPRARCRLPWSRRATAKPAVLHIARGWRARPCPKCKALPGEFCRTPSGREASRIHEARLRPVDTSCSRATTCGPSSSVVARRSPPYRSAAAPAARGSVERILLSRVQGDELVDVERWSGRDELCHALEAPIWDRFGSFAGQPLIVGTVIWTATDRRVVIEGRRGEKRFEELV